MSKPKFLLAVLALIIIVLSVQVFRLIPWRYIRPVSLSETVAPVELPETPELDALEIEGRRLRKEPQPLKARQSTASDSAARPAHKAVASVQAPVKRSFSQELPATGRRPANDIQSPPAAPQESPTPPPAKAESAPKDIVVHLSALRADTVLQQPQTPFPTIENNSILRRHENRKRRSSRR